MSRRAWWLIILSLFIPGSAQLLAGNRRLGRILFGSWLSFIGLIALGLTLNAFFPAFVLTVATSGWTLLLVQIGLIYTAIVWFVAAADTFRLVRFVYVGRRAKGWVALAVIFSLIVPPGIAAYGSFVSGISRGALGTIFAEAPPVEPIDGVYTFLLIGGDAGPDRISMRTDSMSFATVDATTGQVSIVGLPRNLYNAPFVEGSPMLKKWPNGFNCGDDCLLAYVYTYGIAHKPLYPTIDKKVTNAGVEALRDSVEAIVGMPVQFYVAVDMAGFANLVDALGGVDMDLAAPIHFCEFGQPVTYTFPAGKQHLDGAKALMYARTRCDTNDIERMKQQRDLEAAIFKQVKPSVVAARFQDLAAASTSLVKTDIPQSMVGTLLAVAQKGRKLPIQRGDLAPPEFDNLYPDWELSKSMVHDIVFPAKSSNG